MVVKVKSGKIRLFVPMPLSLAGLALKVMPESAFAEIRSKIAAPYNTLTTKENAELLYGECKDIIKSYRGIEIVHIESHDGTFVSVKL